MTEKIVTMVTTVYKVFKTKEEAIEHIKSGKTMLSTIKGDLDNIVSIYPPDHLEDAYNEFYSLIDDYITRISKSVITHEWITEEPIINIVCIKVNDFGDIVDYREIIRGNTKHCIY